MRLEAFGTTRPPGERPLGSILSAEDAARRLNLHSDASIAVFDRRRSEGWGIDPVRTLGYLTSSQALTLNLMAPFVEEPAWMVAVLNLVLPLAQPLTGVDAVHFEYFSPQPSKALGDRTTIDVLIHARQSGRPIVVAIETKLGDRFNSRSVHIGDAYSRVSHLWLSPLTPHERATSQLARVHALAEHVSRSAYGGEGPALVLLLHHDDDPSAPTIAGKYAGAVACSDSFHSASLRCFLEAMRVTAPTPGEADLVETLRLRYVELHRSESVWREFLRATPSTSRRRAATASA